VIAFSNRINRHNRRSAGVSHWIALVAALLLPIAASAQAPHPADIGLQVEKPAGDGKLFSHGSGVLLGDGMVLTAAHVIAVNPQDPKVTVFLDNRRVDGLVAFSGQSEHVDLALIKVDPANLPPSKHDLGTEPVCARNPGPAQPVVVAWMGKTTQETTLLRADPPKDASDPTPYSTMLAAGHPKGASGGGVFDPQRACLLGILVADGTFNIDIPGVPHEITIFLPASEISSFLKKYREQRR
jgi:hypothetical protein